MTKKKHLLLYHGQMTKMTCLAKQNFYIKKSLTSVDLIRV